MMKEERRVGPRRETPGAGGLLCGPGERGSAGTTARPPRVFHDEALRRLREYDEAPTAGEAELAGPWRVVRLGADDFGVFQPGDDEGDRPLARFAGRHLAMLVAAALPGVGRPSSFKVHPEADDRGHAVLRDGHVAGGLAVFLGDLAPALCTLDAVVRSPLALAWLLEAAGPTALERAGRVLGQRLMGSADGKDA